VRTSTSATTTPSTRPSTLRRKPPLKVASTRRRPPGPSALLVSLTPLPTTQTSYLAQHKQEPRGASQPFTSPSWVTLPLVSRTPRSSIASSSTSAFRMSLDGGLALLRPTRPRMRLSLPNSKLRRRQFLRNDAIDMRGSWAGMSWISPCGSSVRHNV
jgi:hypothetical protein